LELLDLLKNNKKTVGLKQSLKAIKNGEAKAVIIAKDADKTIIKQIEDICKNESIQIYYAENMKELGNACNIDVGASVVCILK